MLVSLRKVDHDLDGDPQGKIIVGSVMLKRSAAWIVGALIALGLGNAASGVASAAQPDVAQVVQELSGPTEFGYSVATLGTTAVVGAPSAEEVFVYHRSGTTWAETAVLTAPGAGTDGNNAGFGTSVAISGGTIVVGAPNEYSQTGFGSAYVYDQDRAKWRLQATLEAGDKVPGDETSFGLTVGIAVGTIMIGAPTNKSDQVVPSGVYVFTESGSTWSQTQKITSTNGIGLALAVSGSEALIGNPDETDALVYTDENGAWDLTATLSVPGTEVERLGRVVAVEGDLAAVTVEGPGPAPTGQLVYVFSDASGTWVDSAKLQPTSTSTTFGTSLAIDGTEILVGQPNSRLMHSGRVNRYELQGSEWNEESPLTSPDGNPYFGNALSALGKSILVGAGTPPSANAYLFLR